jgi:hypothetical protein
MAEHNGEPVKILLLLSFLAPHLPAQSLPSVLSIDFYRPKRDRVDEMEAAIKDYNVAAAKNGYTGTGFMFNSRGRNEEVRIVPYPNWAALQTAIPSASHEHDTEMTRADFRIREANDSARQVLVQVVPQLSIPIPAEMPKLVQFVWTKIPTDKKAEYEAALATQDPSVRKSFKLYLFCRVMFGDVQQHLLIVGMDDWSDLDKPIQRVSGEEAWRAFRAKVDPMILERREDIYRYAPELTYKPK